MDKIIVQFSEKKNPNFLPWANKKVSPGNTF